MFSDRRRACVRGRGSGMCSDRRGACVAGVAPAPSLTFAPALPLQREARAGVRVFLIGAGLAGEAVACVRVTVSVYAGACEVTLTAAMVRGAARSRRNRSRARALTAFAWSRSAGACVLIGARLAGEAGARACACVRRCPLACLCRVRGHGLKSRQAPRNTHSPLQRGRRAMNMAGARRGGSGRARTISGRSCEPFRPPPFPIVRQGRGRGCRIERNLINE
jgi:hypothetical protein